jgi:hypothetical protein
MQVEVESWHGSGRSQRVPFEYTMRSKVYTIQYR